jgi:hypothetical protein
MLERPRLSLMSDRFHSRHVSSHISSPLWGSAPSSVSSQSWSIWGIAAAGRHTRTFPRHWNLPEPLRPRHHLIPILHHLCARPRHTIMWRPRAKQPNALMICPCLGLQRSPSSRLASLLHSRASIQRHRPDLFHAMERAHPHQLVLASRISGLRSPWTAAR